METYLIHREIGIDAAHRVPHHGSKCRNLHGHRYTVVASCGGPLLTQGEQQGMVLDFGFLKEEMLNVIDKPCDHGTILWVGDPLVDVLRTYALDLAGKVYILPRVPTAENLARHWFQALAPRVVERSDGQAKLVRLRVYETPNCWADYPGQPQP